MSCNKDAGKSIYDLIQQTGLGGSANVDVRGINPIFVNETLEDVTKVFTVNFEQYVPLSATFGLTPTAIQLQGNVVNNVVLNWSYNKPSVEQQAITAPSVTIPSLALSDRTLNLTTAGVDEDKTFTLTADDIIGDSNPPITRTAQVLFGNYFYVGVTELITDSTPEATLRNLILDNFHTRVIRRTRTQGFTCEGTGIEYEYVAYPTRFGLATFQDTQNFAPGGFVLIGTVTDVPNGSTNDFRENYYLYRSVNINLDGAVFNVS
jgi:hypothetical protein